MVPTPKFRNGYARRLRVLSFDFDGRWAALNTTSDPPGALDETHARMRESLRSQFGIDHFDAKLKNYMDLGPKPMSVLAYHNIHLDGCRDAFVIGSYYPALTGACAMGERILNELVIDLRKHYQATPEHAEVATMKSSSNWKVMNNTLKAWGVLLEEVWQAFKDLAKVRHRSLHFNPTPEKSDRALALEALKLIQTVIGHQFSAFGPQPWFLTGIPGEIYIKGEWTTHPFILEVYTHNTMLVSPYHRLDAWPPTRIHEDVGFDQPVSDEEFIQRRLEFNSRKRNTT